MTVLVALCAFGGLVGLCLAMDKHYQQVFGAAPAASFRKVLRVVGWSLLSAALALNIARDGGSFGLLAWLGWLLAMGLCLVLCLATVSLLHRDR